MDETPPTTGVANAHAHDVAEVLGALDSDPRRGLSTDEVKRRRETWGENVLRARKPVSLLVILVNQLKSPVVLLLVVAAALALGFGELIDAAAIAVVLLINTLIGFVTELRAVRSMESLQNMVTHAVRVRRGGAPMELPARDLVPGDIVLVDAGDVLSADMRVIDSANLGCDESVLTGESLPVSKSTDPVAPDTTLAERTSMLHSGAAITRGTGEAVVTATGMATELGRITKLVDESEPERSPLDRRLEKLGRDLIWLTLAIAVAVAVAGIAAGGELTLMIETAIALAVAAIPEGLPIVATLALARGMIRMARRNALIRNLSAVETLGATTVVLTDKTGTLTENRMRVARVETPAGPAVFDRDGFRAEEPAGAGRVDEERGALLRDTALCSNATFAPDNGAATGDPMEVALLQAAAADGLIRDDLLAEEEEVAEHAFDEKRKMMATVHRVAGGYHYAVKGAPEAVFDHCTASIDRGRTTPFDEAALKMWRERCDRMAADGLRLLAVAEKTDRSPDADPYAGLTLRGLVALNDPPREDAAEAISEARRAGVKVVMVTGDHGETARSIATGIGLADDGADAVRGADLPPLDSLAPEEAERVRATTIFSRVTPEQKLDLVTLHQAAGEIVAMTGDGVNDAPAIRKADIGIAMGRRGTAVAREAADMVLSDDAFATIVHAIREGRVVYTNIRRFTAYLLSCNLSEVLVVGLAVGGGAPLPLLPLQILFLNLVTDVFPALALGATEAGRDVLARPPRPPSEPILTRHHWAGIVINGIIIAAVTLAALAIAILGFRLEEEAATTMSFTTLALAQVFHVFSMRNWREPLWDNPVSRNLWVWGAVVLCIGLLAVAIVQPQLAEVLHLTPLPLAAWATVAGLSLVPVVLRELTTMVARIRHRGAD